MAYIRFCLEWKAYVVLHFTNVFFFVCSIKLLMSDVVQTAYMVIQDITWFELPISYDEN